ncbi:hypothetical protein B0T40_22655 [Chromobacterium haemolyticum]|uniref:TniQ family protein n=1 Tax=Chromobacterium haemolyticum TaxID=394935 RepID=UPI0009DAD521|nr:TniQ family protein [Chromobacterium haemolyticum]OQS31315.1 hypothetical protein B0T40_22655 [Chromobacterium haemolyticum]
MLAYFPQIYPDELLYSVLARYHRHTGSTSPKQTLDDLFGDRHVIARPDLPGHLELLVQRIPASRDLSRVRVIMELTLYPYFLAFADGVRRGYARQAMEARGTSGLYLKLGLAASRVPVVNVLLPASDGGRLRGAVLAAIPSVARGTGLCGPCCAAERELGVARPREPPCVHRRNPRKLPEQ